MAKIVILEELCKGCELCIAFCPKGIIKLAEHYNKKGYHPVLVVDNEDKCTGCAICARMCPDVAIEVYK